MSDQIPDGSAVTTPNEMFAELRQVHEEVRSLKSLIDPALTDIRQDVAGHGSEISQLRADHAVLKDQMTTMRTTLRVIYGCMAFLLVIIATLAAVFQAVHG